MRITVIADLHGGHPAALWPKKFETPTGNIISANEAQLILLDYWEDFWNKPEVRDSEAVFNLAESIEGYNKKEHGKEIMISDLNLQREAIEGLLKPKVGKRKYRSVFGSRYHDSEDLIIEEQISKHLGGKFYYGHRSIQVGKKIIDIAHDATSALIYKSTALDRNSLFLDAVEGPWDHNKFNFHIDLMVAAHCHIYFLTANESRISYLNPCWKFWHPIRPYGVKNWPRTQPTIGGTVIEIGQDWIWPKLFKYPIHHIYDALVKM